MDEDFLVCSYSEESHRHAILADDGRVGILYLHAPSPKVERTRKVEAASFVFNRVDPIDVSECAKYRPAPPPIAKGYASRHAVCREPKKHKWALIWSADGDGVVLLRDGKPWVLVSINRPRGRTKAVRAEGPWGSPWSNEEYEAIDWTGAGRICK